MEMANLWIINRLLVIQTNLIATTHHGPLSIVLSAIKSSIESGSTAVGTVIVGRARVIKSLS